MINVGHLEERLWLLSYSHMKESDINPAHFVFLTDKMQQRIQHEQFMDT